MCNLYSQTSNAQAIIDLVQGWKKVRDRAGNQFPLPGIFPNYDAPILRAVDDDTFLLDQVLMSGLPGKARHLPSDHSLWRMCISIADEMAYCVVGVMSRVA